MDRSNQIFYNYVLNQFMKLNLKLKCEEIFGKMSNNVTNQNSPVAHRMQLGCKNLDFIFITKHFNLREEVKALLKNSLQ